MILINQKRNIYLHADKDQFMIGKVKPMKDRDTGEIRDELSVDLYFSKLDNLIDYMASLVVKDAIVLGTLEGVRKDIELMKKEILQKTGLNAD